jgi:hypothetical protein
MNLEIWFDSTSKINEPAWAVSLCEHGEKIKYLAKFDVHADAIEWTNRESKRRMMMAVVRLQDGTTRPTLQY